MSTAAATLFRAMADEIERCGEERFAGAMLLVPPAGEPLQVLLSDPERKPGNFWTMAKVRVEMVLADVGEAERLANMSPYGRR